jgi:hypothetical protein
MSVQLQTVLQTARTLVNDDLATVFTDPVLIPKIQEAHRELQEQLWLAGSPIVREQSDPINVAIGVSALTSTAGLPADLLCPIELHDNIAGASLASGGWSPLTETFFIPLGYQPANVLTWWAWRKEILYLSPATAARVLTIKYRRKVNIPDLKTDEIGILFGELYLAARSAALMGGTLGNKDVYDTLTALAKENLGAVIQANRGSQRPIMNV